MLPNVYNEVPKDTAEAVLEKAPKLVEVTVVNDCSIPLIKILKSPSCLVATKWFHSVFQLSWVVYTLFLILPAINNDPIVASRRYIGKHTYVGGTVSNAVIIQQGIIPKDVSDATYNGLTGDLVLTIGSHSYTTSNTIKIAHNSLTFTCDMIIMLLSILIHV